MRKISFMLGLVLLGLTTTFVSCDKDDKKQAEQPVYKDVKIDKTALTIVVGTSQTLEITQGNGGYKVTSSDTDKASASIKNNTQVVVEGKAVGEVTLTITDKQNKQALVEVKVTELSVAKNEVGLIIGATESIAITGTGSYGVSSDNEQVATAEIADNQLKISAKSVGTATITLTDEQTKETQKVSVKVMEELRMEKQELSVKNKDHEIINILGADNANGDYQFEISSEPADVVEVKTQWFDATQGHHLKVTGLKPGEATVSVKDKQTNQVATFKVVVTPADFFLPKTQVELVVSASETINIQGNGQYEVNVANNSIVTTSLNGGVLTIEAVAAGSTNITIKDVLKDETKTIAVTITSPFTIDADGNLTKVDPSVIVANFVIPKNVKTIGARVIFNADKNKETIESVTMESVEVIEPFNFASQKKLTKAMLGDKIKSIGNLAFASSVKLSEVKIKTQTPPTLGMNVFANISKTKVLKVPTGTKAAYEASDWGKFFKSEEIIEED